MSTEEELEEFTIKTSDIVFGQNLQTIVPKLWDNSLFSDVTLVLRSTKIKSHRVVLALLSPKLKKMLDDGNKTELVLEGNDKALVRAFEFLYKGQIREISEDDAIQLLDVASKYEIELLKDAAGNYLADRSTEENLSYLLNIANKYSSSTLLHRCGQFIAENFSNMPKSILNDFEPEVWKGILMSKKIKTESEENLFEAFEEYLSKFKSPKKEELFTEFIKYFHFHEFPGEFLVKIEEKYGHITSVHEKLHQAYRALVYSGKNLAKDTETREYDGPNWSWIGSSPIVLSEHNRTVKNSQSSNRTAVANKPLKEIGHKVWSLKIDLLESGGWIGIGLGAKDSQNLSFTGSEQMFMYSANSYKWPLQQMVGFAFAQGDVITVEVVKNELVYYKNGTNTGKTMTGWSLDMHPLVTVQRAQVTLLRQYKYKS